MKGTPATELAGLEKFAGKVFTGAQGDFTLDGYGYFDDSPLYSTANFATDTSAIAAGTELSLFSSVVGSATGQGYTQTMTRADTNLQKGWDGGKAPNNQCFVALAGGFEVYGVTNGNPAVAISLSSGDVSNICRAMTWRYNVGGSANPTMYYAPIIMYPSNAGAWSAQNVYADNATAVSATSLVGMPAQNGGPLTKMRKFAFPLIFPPGVATSITLAASRVISPIVSTGTPASANIVVTAVRVCMFLRGYLLSKIIG